MALDREERGLELPFTLVTMAPHPQCVSFLRLVFIIAYLYIVASPASAREARRRSSSSSSRQHQQEQPMVPVKKITLVPPTSPDAILNRDRRRGDPSASGTTSSNATRSKSVFEPAKAAPTDEPTRVRVHFQSTGDDSRGTMARGANGGMVITARGDSKGMGGWVLGGSGGEGAMQSLSFCLGCPNPRQEGSMVRGLRSALGPRDYDVTAEVVFAVPNDGSGEIVNKADVKGRIALVNRGTVPMVEKIMRLQQAGAVGVLVIDHGQCDALFHDCGHRAGNRHTGGFAPSDSPSMWRDVTIPSLLLTSHSLTRIRALMPLDEINLRGLGRQLVDAFVL